MILLLVLYAKFMEFLHIFGVCHIEETQINESFPYGNHPYEINYLEQKCLICGKSKKKRIS